MNLFVILRRHIHWVVASIGLTTLIALGIFALFVNVPLASATAAPASDGIQPFPVAYWPLDEQSLTGEPSIYRDVQGGAAGYCAGACPQRVNGLLSAGQRVDGVGSGLVLPTSPTARSLIADAFTVEMWMRGNERVCASAGPIIEQMTEAGTGWRLGCTEDEQIELLLEGHSSAQLAAAAPTHARWQHVVFTYDLDSSNLYLNGVHVASHSAPSGIVQPAEPVRIGSIRSNLNRIAHWQGFVDEVALYSGALSAEEVAFRYYVPRRLDISCAAPVRIMPLGDSITQGKSSGVDDEMQQVAYRRDLWHSLQANGYPVDFVGSLTHGAHYTPIEGFDAEHEGHPGFSAWQLASGTYDWLSANPADVILVHAGTNAVSTNTFSMEHLLNEVDRYSESATVIMARIINRGSGDHAVTSEYNKNLNALAAARIATGDKIVIVDMEREAGIVYAQSALDEDDMWDTLHPSASGYSKMAARWFNALDRMLAPCTDPYPIPHSQPYPTLVPTSTPTSAAPVATPAATPAAMPIATLAPDVNEPLLGQLETDATGAQSLYLPLVVDRQ